MGGNDADAVLVVFVFVVVVVVPASAPPKGVGALADIGGKAADAIVVFGFAAVVPPPPKGVGAFADIGGKAAYVVAIVFASVDSPPPKGVGALTDIGEKAADAGDVGCVAPTPKSVAVVLVGFAAVASPCGLLKVNGLALFEKLNPPFITLSSFFGTPKVLDAVLPGLVWKVFVKLDWFAPNNELKGEGAVSPFLAFSGIVAFDCT